MLECVRCSRTFSQEEIKNGQYCLFSMICGWCYAKMQRNPLLCFGKPQGFDGSLGYNPDDEQCALWCPDRVACRKIVIGEVRNEDRK